MPKRKRDGHEGTHEAQSGIATKLPAKRQSGVKEKIHHAVKVLHRSLKVSKGFERQKLGKRQKTAQQNGSASEVARIEAEIQALKALDLNVAAENHLYKTLQKDKAISTSPLLPEFVLSSSKSGSDAATANVTARLYNSHPAKKALADGLLSIGGALGVEAAPRASLARNTKLSKAKRHQNEEKHRSKNSFGSPHEVIQEVQETAPQRQVDLGNSSEDDEPDDAYGALDARIASSSDSEDESVDYAELKSRGRGEQREVDLSLSPSFTNSPSPSPPTAKEKKSDKDTRPTSSSTYLPSLTMGGYLSGSDSDSAPEMDIPEVAPPRKNRRGQRARQQIWEKKYGNRAKHLQQNEKQRQNRSRDDGWDPKRGAQLDDKGQGKRQNQPRWKQEKAQDEFRDNLVTRSSGTKAAKPLESLKERKQENAGLHPSWEAAKKAKEQVGAFQGQKVVFD